MFWRIFASGVVTDCFTNVSVLRLVHGNNHYHTVLIRGSKTQWSCRWYIPLGTQNSFACAYPSTVIRNGTGYEDARRHRTEVVSGVFAVKGTIWCGNWLQLTNTLSSNSQRYMVKLRSTLLHHMHVVEATRGISIIWTPPKSNLKKYDFWLIQQRKVVKHRRSMSHLWSIECRFFTIIVSSFGQNY